MDVFGLFVAAVDEVDSVYLAQRHDTHEKGSVKEVCVAGVCSAPLQI